MKTLTDKQIRKQMKLRKEKQEKSKKKLQTEGKKILKLRKAAQEYSQKHRTRAEAEAQTKLNQGHNEVHRK